MELFASPEPFRAPVVSNIPTLRDYQFDTICQLFDYYRHHPQGCPIVALPTGTGKSLVIAYIIKTILTGMPGVIDTPVPDCAFLTLTHSKELVDNDAKAYARVMPGADVGVFCADLGRKDKDRLVTFGSIQSVARGLKHFLNRRNPIKAVIIDEAHRVTKKEASAYQTVIAALRQVWPWLTVIGLTATDWRLGEGAMTDLGLFTDRAVNYCTPEKFVWFIQQGYLIKPVPFKTQVELDTTGIKVTRGEFDEDDVAAAMDRQNFIVKALEESTEYGLNDRRAKWLTFVPSIRHVEEAVEWYHSKGISAVAVHSKIDGKERDARLAAHKAGKVKVAVNQNILTTGYDDPALDYINGIRPTLSSSLWVQMIGRGTRPLYAPGFDLSSQAGRLGAIAASPKHDCRVMDFAGNTRRLGPINDPKIPLPPEEAKKRKRGAPEAPQAKLCHECQAWNAPSARFCDECGAPFSDDYSVTADTAKLVVEKASKPKEPPPPRIEEWFDVKRMTAVRHQSRQGKPSVLITYFTTSGKAFKYYLPVGTTQALYAGRKWWSAHCPGYGYPGNIDGAMVVSHAFRSPSRIKVWTNKPGEYSTEVLTYEFNADAGASPNNTFSPII